MNLNNYEFNLAKGKSGVITPTLLYFVTYKNEIVTENRIPITHTLREEDMEIFDILTNDEANGNKNDVGDIFEDILILSTPPREAGKYGVEVSFVASFGTANRSIEWKVIGDIISPSFIEEPKDATDYFPLYYGFNIDHAGGEFTCTLQGKKESGSATLNFDAVNLVFKRIG